MVVDANPGAGDVGKFGQVEVRSRSGVLLNEPTGTVCGLGYPGITKRDLKDEDCRWMEDRDTSPFRWGPQTPLSLR